MRCPRCDYALPSSDRFCGRCGLARASDGFPIDPLIGLTVADRYRIEQRIGVGGMGTVYLGTQLKVGQRVAIKVLHERYSDDITLTQRFEREAMTYARVSHPNLVALHDFGRTADNCYFMVLEYCPGIALAKLVRSGERLDTSLVVEIIIQVARGLGAAHDAGVVHRDLKPENVMLVDAGSGRYHVKLLDFGIAKRLDDEGPRLTQVGMVFGTPEYMAPEQARGETVDLRSDIYALGCMLYELMTGDPPFTGSNKLQIMHRQASEKPLPPSAKLGGVHPALEAIALRCLSKKAAERYADTRDFIDAVEAVFGQSRPTPIPPRMRLRRTEGAVMADTELSFVDEKPDEAMLATEVVELKHTPRPMRVTEPPTPSRLPVFIMGGVALLVLIIVVAFWGEEDADRRAVAVPSDVVNASTPSEAAPESVAAPQTDAAPESVAAPATDAAPQTDAAPVSVAAPKTAAPISLAPESVAAPAPVSRAPATRARPVAPATRAPKKRGPSKAQLARRLNDAKRAYNRGQLEQARREVLAILSADRRHSEAKALKAQIADTERRIERGRKAYKAHDCATVLKALKPVVEASPSATVVNMVNACNAALPPRKIGKLN